jgi:hypothetical protein
MRRPQVAGGFFGARLEAIYEFLYLKTRNQEASHHSNASSH